MSKQKYQLWWTDDRGNRIFQIEDWAFLNYARIVHGVGYLNLGLPFARYGDFFRKDYKVEVWRAPEVGEKRRLEDSYIMRKPKYYTREGDQVDMMELTGHNGVGILQTRIEKFKATTSQAEKTDFIDDMMKEFVDEQLGAAALADDADRAAAYNEGFFQIQSSSGGGASVSFPAPYLNLLDILKRLHNVSRQQTPRVYFDVVPLTPAIYEFRTYLNQRGSDKRFSTGQSTLLFSKENGNLRGPQLVEDTFEEKNVVYVGGQGEGENRAQVEREDTSLSTNSIWARREIFRDARHASTTAELESIGDETLGENRPIFRFVSDFLDVPGSKYGVDWDLGDRITASYANRLIDCDMQIVYVTVPESGEESIFGRNEHGEFTRS